MSLSGAIETAKAAANAVYDAVLNLPFELEVKPPRDKRRVQTYLKRCRKWHDEVVLLFNSAVGACKAQIADSLSLNAILGHPEFGDDQFGRDKWGFDDSSSRYFMNTFDERVKAIGESNKRVFAQFGICEPRVIVVRQLLLDLQLRARSLTRWVFERLDWVSELTLPRITLTEGGSRSHVARVEFAGAVRERPISQRQLDLLVDLCEGKSVNFGRCYVRTRLLKAVRELDGLIHVVDASKDNAWYRLDKTMVGRIIYLKA